SQTKLAPEWIGGYSLNGNWTQLQMHMADDRTAQPATIDVPSLEIRSQPVSGFRRQSSTVSFRLPLAATQLDFEGRLDADVIEATVGGGEGAAGFNYCGPHCSITRPWRSMWVRINGTRITWFTYNSGMNWARINSARLMNRDRCARFIRWITTSSSLVRELRSPSRQKLVLYSIEGRTDRSHP